jgi:DNA-binding NarL/FixJ family response regulator
MDLLLPFLDGFSVLKKAQKIKKKLPPIVVVCSLRQPEDIKKALALGIEKYYVKNETSMAEVIHTIEKLMQ